MRAGRAVGPARDLAFVLQDLDKLGDRLRADASPGRHRAIAGALASLAGATVEWIEGDDVLGRVVYAGGGWIDADQWLQKAAS